VVDPILLPKVYKEEIEEGVQLAIQMVVILKIKERIEIYLHSPLLFTE
jgi:hypothetical protein